MIPFMTEIFIVTIPASLHLCNSYTETMVPGVYNLHNKNIIPQNLTASNY